MKIMLDNNIILDLLLEREPFATSAAHLFSLAEQGKLFVFIHATAVTTIFYLIAKNTGTTKAKSAIAKLMSLFEIAPVNRLVLEDALQLKFNDFEDAVLHEAARHAGVQAVITRNHKDFQKATLPVYSPMELLNLLNLTAVV